MSQNTTTKNSRIMKVADAHLDELLDVLRFPSICHHTLQYCTIISTRPCRLSSHHPRAQDVSVRDRGQEFGFLIQKRK